MALRWFTPAATAVVLGSACAIAVAQNQESPLAGTYGLTGTQGTTATIVTLTVADDGSVSRVVTLPDGTKQTFSAKGTVDGSVLHATFPVSATGDATASSASDPTNLNGAWSVRGQNGFGPYTGTATFFQKGGGWESTFKYTYSNGSGSGTAIMNGTLTGSVLAGTRLRTTGLAGTLTGVKRESYPCKYTLSSDGLTLDGTYGPSLKFTESFTRPSVPAAAGSDASPNAITATYTFDGNGGVDGTLANPSNAGGWTSAHESGSLVKDVRIVSPAPGSAVLSGQVLPVVVAPAGATWDVASGPARKAKNGQLQVTGTGDVVLVAKLADKTSDPDKIKAVTLEIIEITVDGSQPISDSAAPHMKRTLGSQDKPVVNPAALLLGDKLKLHVKVAAAGDLAQPVKVTLTGAASGGLALSADGPQTLSGLKAGQDVVLTSSAALNTKINVNILDLTFTIETDAGTVDAGPHVPLRVYTIFKPTVTNGPYYGEQSRPIPTKNHLELACTWASGTSKNVGNGGDSICYKLDNYVRHHVHPIDFKPAKMPFTSAYDWNSKTPPLNYKDLDGAADTASLGERPVGQLYYPPLEVKDAAKEDYSHYSSNFGWWVLDNPSNTGGRCNQQASLMCDLFGTFGIKGKVHYLQRVGSGAQSGRPVRQYFNSEKGGEYWNFHGLAEATLDDGTTWLYDGSFSWAPDRKNGVTQWAEAPGRWLNQDTPFIYEFGPWYYEDAGGIVPTSDIPTAHVDGDNPAPGQYDGVPAAKNEDLAWYNKTKH
jgi:hypothetical protein